MKLEQIRPLAERFIEQFKHCAERTEIAGSIHREKPECKDIEIVCIPKYNMRTDLFGDETSKENKLIQQLRLKLGAFGKEAGFKFIKGNNDCPRYTQLETMDGIKIDLFFATPENWGWIFFLRTGPSEWNIKVMQRLKERGYVSQDGYIHERHVGSVCPDKIFTPNENDIFNLLGWPWVEPRDRK